MSRNSKKKKKDPMFEFVGSIIKEGTSMMESYPIIGKSIDKLCSKSDIPIVKELRESPDAQAMLVGFGMKLLEKLVNSQISGGKVTQDPEVPPFKAGQ